MILVEIYKNGIVSKEKNVYSRILRSSNNVEIDESYINLWLNFKINNFFEATFLLIFVRTLVNTVWQNRFLKFRMWSTMIINFLFFKTCSIQNLDHSYHPFAQTFLTFSLTSCLISQMGLPTIWTIWQFVNSTQCGNNTTQFYLNQSLLSKKKMMRLLVIKHRQDQDH